MEADWTKVEVLTLTWSEQNIKPSQICGQLKNSKPSSVDYPLFHSSLLIGSGKN